MAKAIMVQGTGSGAGKSLTVAGLCRIFKQDGYSVAPFKSQNMALNSFITREGLEMGRAQVVQAEAAGIEPSVLMNPILLKPTGDATSQVIVDGEVVANLGAADYYRRKTEFIPAVKRAYQALAARHDLVIIEGAGSPAEINLAENDIVNMGMAAIADAPVLLVGDIDRGGVFASLYGTVKLPPPEEQRRFRGLIINKFRGDVEILRPGLADLERLTGVPVLGVVPWLDLDIDDEDSLTSRFSARRHGRPLDMAVLRLPRIANFTDFNPLERHPAVGVRYVGKAAELGSPDIVIVPGSKNTMADLAWLRQNGLEAGIKKLAAAGVLVIGICGGFQMLGMAVRDPDHTEQGGEMRGMELLPVETVFVSPKTRTRVDGTVGITAGPFACLAGAAISGYEIHMGVTEPCGPVERFASLRHLDGATVQPDGAVAGNVLGSYVHGLFDSGDVIGRLAEKVLADKGISTDAVPAAEMMREDGDAYKDRQYNALAEALRSSLDIEAIYRIVGLR